MRIVFADDSVIVRQRLTRLFSDIEGIEIVGQADDVPVARELVEKLKPDVAILDMRMRTGSGADLVPELKQLVPALKVIILTNYPYVENRKKCMELGADFFFDKSNEFQRVLSVLRSMIRAPYEKPTMLSVDLSRLSEKELENAIVSQCSSFGTVRTVCLHLNRSSPLARPFALISMETLDEAERVASAFGQHALGGSAIIFLRQADGSP
jgi:DNA-binding NarL/FixJ family response regulator